MTSDQSSGTNGREDAAAGIADAAPALSRRQALLLLGTGAVGASAAAFAGCESERPATGEEGRSDVELLNDALELEYSGVAVYGAEPDPLGSDLREIAQQFAEQAAERVERLTALVAELGGTPLEPRADEEYLEEVGLTQVEDEDGFIRVAIELENAAVAGYTDAVAELSDPELRRVFYELTGNSAAHISVLLGAAGEVQVPDALVTGQPA
jgi:rubrerythrin